MKQILVAVLSLAILTGCAASHLGDAHDDPVINRVDAENVYVSQSIELPENIGEITGWAYSGETIYFASIIRDSDEKESILPSGLVEIYSVNADGTELTRLADYTPMTEKPDNSSGYISIHNITIDGDGSIWVVETWDFDIYDLPAGFDAQRDDPREYITDADGGVVLRKLSTSGEQLQSVDISIFTRQESQSVSAIEVDKDDDGGEIIYLGCWNFAQQRSVIYLLDVAGVVQFKLDADPYINRFIRLEDGSVSFPRVSAATYFIADNREQSLQIIDAAKKSFGENVIDIPDVGMYIYSGGGNFDLLISDGIDVYGYIFGEEHVTRLFNWMESRITGSNTQIVAVLDNGQIICAKTSQNIATGRIDTRFIVLTETPRSELPEKTVLTLATLMALPDYLNEAIAEYNADNPFYDIYIKNYSDGSNRNNALLRLNTEITAGNIPDMLYIFSMPYDEYAKNGLLADVYQLIDDDSEYNRDDYIKEALLAAEINGSLYTVFPGFVISTVVGSADVVGPNIGWNMDEFLDVLDAHPEADIPLGVFYNRESFIVNMIDEFIDWDTGEVYFDTPRFVHLLETAARISSERVPETDASGRTVMTIPLPDEYIASGRQIMQQTSVIGFDDLPRYRERFGGDITFKGWPCESRSGNKIEPMYEIAIVAQSANKEAAWLFARTWFKAEYLKDIWHGFPVNRAAFEKKADNALIADPVNPYKPEVTQDDIDTVISLIESAAAAQKYPAIDTSFSNIIEESISDYFNGIISTEDAARVIQSKVSIFVSERVK